MMSASRYLSVPTVLVTLALGSACAPGPIERPAPMGPIATGPGTIAEARRYLEGRWSMVSFDLYPPGEPPIHVVGTGELIYDNFGNMTVEFRVDPETARLARRIGIPAPDGIISTSGLTLIDVTSRSVSYVLEGQEQSRPSTHPLDTNRPRYYEVDGNTVTLRTRDEQGAVLSVSVWTKQP